MSRLINADVLYMKLVKMKDFGELTAKKAIRVVENAPTIDAVPHWIPCSERLPEDGDYKPFSYYEDGAVLFCTKDGKIGFGWYYESTKQWANEDDKYPGEVIAWMPLPKPYEVEEWRG